jgi:cyclase
MNIRRMWVSCALAIVAAAGPASAGQAPAAPAGSPVPGLTFKVAGVGPGIHVLVGEGVPYYVANSVLIEGEEEALLVDSGAGPNEARALRKAVETLTKKPIRYVVDTHFHFDHALGNAVFPEAISVAHAATREGLALGVKQPTLANMLAGLPGAAQRMRTQAATEQDAAKRAGLESDAAKAEAYAKALSSLVPAPPQITFTDHLTIWLGTREVRILFLGRGHTAGDAVVYLPADRILCSGDLYNGYIGFMGDAFVDEWADTLDRLGALDFRTTIPGHGWPFDGKDAMAPVQACLRDIWKQAAQFKRDGVPVADAAARMDLRAHAASFPRFATIGFDRVAVERIYAVLEDRSKK